MADGLECANRAVQEAEQAGDQRALALALDVLNSVLLLTGRLDEAIHRERVLKIYEELGDEVRVSITLNNLAAVAFFGSRWDQSAELLARCAEASTAAGDVAQAAVAQVNLAEIRINQGRLDEALELLAPARRTLQSYGQRNGTAVAELQLGRAIAFRGDVEEGLALVRSAAATFDENRLGIEAIDARARLAEILAFALRPSEAEEVLVEARELELHGMETPVSATLDRVELTLAASSGDLSVLTARLDGFLERATRLHASYETLVVLTLVERLGDLGRHPEVSTRARDLGVVSLPMLPDIEAA
jgi:tetratricopeptide (TPR) repeat protein